jgi:hypothetical protein
MTTTTTIKKAAPLTAGLVAVKGNAAPILDMPTRSPAAPDSEPAPVEPGLPLNFRVPADFRRAFKTYAAQHDLKLNELLRLSFDSYRKQRD